ncbi:MAG: N-acetyltransferase [Pseudomonadota bacterium]
MIDDIIVRPEQTTDVNAVDVVNISAFEGEKEAQLVADLRKSPYYIPALALVAEVHGRLVGHIMLSKAQLNRRGLLSEVLVLAPMSVVPSQSHRGIGTRLVQEATGRAQRMGYRAVIVTGQPEYYQKLGFHKGSRWRLYSTLPVPDSAISAMELHDGTFKEGDTVQYPVEFLRLY